MMPIMTMAGTVSGSLGHAENALDASCRAADDAANRSPDDSPDRTGRPIAGLGACGRTSTNALGVNCHGQHKNG